MATELERLLVRKCSKCSLSKPQHIDYFRAEPRTKVGFHSMCRECEQSYSKQQRANNPNRDKDYYEKNKEILLQKQRKYKAERLNNNREAVHKAAAEYREKNREKINEYSRDWRSSRVESERERVVLYYQNNPDKRKERYEKIENWRKENRDKARSYVRNRRAKIKNSEGTHTAEDIRKLYSGQKGCCWWCSQRLADNYHVDHRIPIVKGGSNSPSNLVISCPSCNLTKNAKMPWELKNARLV